MNERHKQWSSVVRHAATNRHWSAGDALFDDLAASRDIQTATNDALQMYGATSTGSILKSDTVGNGLTLYRYPNLRVTDDGRSPSSQDYSP